ncbi:MAG: selenocysteine-specific translation elongation factor [Chloroflexi bacterium]|nr:selenocysteine-specific translation elongation factor [Chloroflexota bacterium]
MTVIIGTAGHIDHGKTTLLRALTGIDADRLPEEQRRGMTIDVGYAHLDLEDGSSIDFVDVPGHDALIGNTLVGAGEIDAVLLVVAADDGPRAQTIEHLELLDALAIRDGLVVVTKADIAGGERSAGVAADVDSLLAGTSLAGSPILVASSTSGEGLPEVRAAIVRLRDLVTARAATQPAGPTRLAIDRAFVVKGRGVVVTGSLRGGSVRVGDALRLEPSGIAVRVRGLHVHHGPVEIAEGGRTAVNLAGVELDAIRRGAILTSGSGIEVTGRILAQVARPTAMRSRRGALAWPPADGARVRLHLGTDQVDALVGRRGREAAGLPDGTVTAVLRLAAPMAIAVGDRGVLRRPSPGDLLGSVRIIDTDPPRGASRRRATPERLAGLAISVAEADVEGVADALVALHGALSATRIAGAAGALRQAGAGVGAEVAAGIALAPDLRDAIERDAVAAVQAHHRDHPLDVGMPLTGLRRSLRADLRRHAAIRRDLVAAADAAVDGLVADLVRRRRLARDGDRLRDPAREAGPSAALAASMARLEALLNLPAPPALAAAAQEAGCPADGIRALEASGRIVRIEADLAWSALAFQRLAAQALALARRAPLTPAILRDATGTSRRYVLPLVEDLGRRGILTRTPAGHVPGPRAPREPVGR